MGKLRRPCSITNFPTCHQIVSQLRRSRGDDRLDDSDASQHGVSRFLLDQFRERFDCLQQLTPVHDHCHMHLQAECQSAGIKAVKVVRLSMETVRLILEKDPSVKVKVCLCVFGACIALTSAYDAFHVQVLFLDFRSFTCCETHVLSYTHVSTRSPGVAYRCCRA